MFEHSTNIIFRGDSPFVLKNEENLNNLHSSLRTSDYALKSDLFNSYSGIWLNELSKKGPDGAIVVDSSSALITE